MTYWAAAALVAVGYFLRMAWERPNRFADIDELIAQQRDRARAETRDV